MRRIVALMIPGLLAIVMIVGPLSATARQAPNICGPRGSLCPEARVQLLHDGNFEDPTDGGASPAWVAVHAGHTPLPALTRSAPHHGRYALELGGRSASKPHGSALVWQTVTIPRKARSAALTFWYRAAAASCQVKAGYSQRAFLATPRTPKNWLVHQRFLWTSAHDNRWRNVTAALNLHGITGAKIIIAFEVIQNGCWGSLTVDDASLTVAGPIVTPTATATATPPATNTPLPTSTPAPTNTPAPTATATMPAPTATSLPPPTATSTPLPTATATATSTPLTYGVNVTASVSNDAPPQNADVTVTGTITNNGQGIAGLQMTAVWHFPSGDQTCTAVTDNTGTAACTLNIDDATPYQTIHIDVYFEYNNQSYGSEVGVIPQP